MQGWFLILSTTQHNTTDTDTFLPHALNMTVWSIFEWSRLDRRKFGFCCKIDWTRRDRWSVSAYVNFTLISSAGGISGLIALWFGWKKMQFCKPKKQTFIEHLSTRSIWNIAEKSPNWRWKHRPENGPMEAIQSPRFTMKKKRNDWSERLTPMCCLLWFYCIFLVFWIEVCYIHMLS